MGYPKKLHEAHMRQLLLFPENEFQVGDRVVCQHAFVGQHEGEIGTVMFHQSKDLIINKLYQKKICLPVKLDNWMGIQCINVNNVKHI